MTLPTASGIGVNYLVVGLHGSGKTTYLSAFWHVVQSDEVQGSLTIDRLTGDREHLNRITKAWQECRPHERTKRSAEKMVSMTLKGLGTTVTGSVVFPDMSGESFRDHWTERSWSAEYAEFVKEAAGVLLFVHPDRLEAPYRISEANTILEALGGEASTSGDEREAEEVLQTSEPLSMAEPSDAALSVDNTSEEGEPAATDAPTPAIPAEAIASDSPSAPSATTENAWDPEKAPTQVILVDALQNLIDAAQSRPFKAAVIISAWDLVAAEGRTPGTWLLERLPLLSQFLRANPETVTSKVFGISAQGGELAKDAKRLLKLPATERILVKTDDSESHDITAPVRWIMGQATDA